MDRIRDHAETILETMIDGVVVTDPEGKIIYANSSAETILGLSRDEILKTYYFDKEWNNIDSEGQPLKKEDLPLSNALQNREEIDNFEHALVDAATGKTIWLSVNAVPLSNGKDEILGALATFRDITWQKTIEKQLERAGRFSSAILDAAGMLIVILDGAGRIQIFNKTCREITGYTPQEVAGRIFWEFLIPEEEIAGVKTVFESLREGEFPSRHENFWLTKDGEKRYIAWSNTTIFDAEGEIEYIIGTGIDITERKKHEDHVIKQFRQEVSYLQSLIDTQTTRTTAQSFGQRSLSFNHPELFQGFIREFSELLGSRIEELAYKRDGDVSGNLKKLANRLGYVSAGPRDIIELYVESLDKKLPSVGPQKIDAFTDEGRLLVLELMGYLVSYYRNFYTEAPSDGENR